MCIMSRHALLDGRRVGGRARSERRTCGLRRERICSARAGQRAGSAPGRRGDCSNRAYATSSCRLGRSQTSCRPHAANLHNVAGFRLRPRFITCNFHNNVTACVRRTQLCGHSLWKLSEVPARAPSLASPQRSRDGAADTALSSSATATTRTLRRPRRFQPARVRNRPAAAAKRVIGDARSKCTKVDADRPALAAAIRHDIALVDHTVLRHTTKSDADSSVGPLFVRTI
jgi:hypothetical protein